MSLSESKLISIENAKKITNGKLLSLGLKESFCEAITNNLIRADMLGHSTHGLELLPHYVNEIQAGGMKKYGDPIFLKNNSGHLYVDAQKLPGAWVLNQVIDELIKESNDKAVVSASIKNIFHIGALQVYLERIVQQDLICLLTTTDPGISSVAPFGGISPVLTSNPIAFGAPTESNPILIDNCTSVISNATVRNAIEKNTKLPPATLLDNKGNLSNDPNRLNDNPPATIMPLGGEHYGYKGFAMGIIVEALALGLSGFGRIDKHERLFGEGVYLQIINPEYYAGKTYFKKEMQHLVDLCHASEAINPSNPVRMPGENALKKAKQAEEKGIYVSAKILKLLSSEEYS